MGFVTFAVIVLLALIVAYLAYHGTRKKAEERQRALRQMRVRSRMGTTGSRRA